MGPNLDPIALARRIVEESKALGFHRAGIAPVEPAARHQLFREWIDGGRHGEMTYLARSEDVERRRDPGALLAGARTIVSVALAYAGGAPPPPEPGTPRGIVARYARGRDYHMVLKEKLGALAARIAAALEREVAWRACVDTAALLERDAAEAAGVGFVAKNTMLIAPGLGSYVVLGELLLDVEATPTAEEPARKRCGECRACLDACPTGAFVDAYVLDARRCISYLTIERRGAIPRELRASIGTRIFGCDVCQEVCPFNAASPAGGEAGAPELIPLLGLGQNQFRRFVRRTALRRIHRSQLLRNVCVALGNAGDTAAVPALRAAFQKEGPLVREHAAWALGRLGDHAWLAAQPDQGQDPPP